MCTLICVIIYVLLYMCTTICVLLYVYSYVWSYICVLLYAYSYMCTSICVLIGVRDLYTIVSKCVKIISIYIKYYKQVRYMSRCILPKWHVSWFVFSRWLVVFGIRQQRNDVLANCFTGSVFLCCVRHTLTVAHLVIGQILGRFDKVFSVL